MMMMIMGGERRGNVRRITEMFSLVVMQPLIQRRYVVQTSLKTSAVHMQSDSLKYNACIHEAQHTELGTDGSGVRIH
jgi:hypothetical protein